MSTLTNSYVAFLRAVNVGGAGKLPMSDLKEMCHTCGFENAKTYVATGNALFFSDQDAETCRLALTAKLKAYAGKPIDVMIRTADRLVEIVRANPFTDAKPNQVIVFLFSQPQDTIKTGEIKNRKDEEIHVAGKEIYVHFPSGQGASRLRFPQMAEGTGRNLNTLTKLAALAK